jgi:NAD(P)-dependent dehydrogenase (short-subunit alcohol dehydrogenase family)
MLANYSAVTRQFTQRDSPNNRSLPTPGRYHEAHEAAYRNGPGDARPTALQTIKDENLEGKLTGKVVVITGCSGGIGVETVRAIHATGATIFATARKEAALLEILKEIETSRPRNKAPLIPIIMDQDSLDSVRQGANEILQKSGGKVNILICNAGIMATPEGKTKDGFETQFGVCHLSHFLLFSMLSSALLAGSTPEFHSRVITISSTGHQTCPVRLDDYGFEKTPYDPWLAYGQAKTANIWMVNEIQRRYGSRGLHGLSLHPGGIDTALHKHTNGGQQAKFSNPEVARYMKSPAQGAATSVYAAVSKALEGKGAKWLSNCEEWGPLQSGGAHRKGFRLGDDGYAPWAFDEEGAKQLWADSCKMVGVYDD